MQFLRIDLWLNGWFQVLANNLEPPQPNGLVMCCGPPGMCLKSITYPGYTIQHNYHDRKPINCKTPKCQSWAIPWLHHSMSMPESIWIWLLYSHPTLAARFSVHTKENVFDSCRVWRDARFCSNDGRTFGVRHELISWVQVSTWRAYVVNAIFLYHISHLELWSWSQMRLLLVGLLGANEKEIRLTHFETATN